MTKPSKELHPWRVLFFTPLPKIYTQSDARIFRLDLKLGWESFHD